MAELPRTIRLHLYCHGLGDCLLLEMPREGERPFWLLIDCGLHSSAKGSSETIRKVVDDIGTTTDWTLDAIAVTHEHWDHISGFIHAKDLFARFAVGEIWFSWAENPEDPDAKQLDKYKAEAGEALAGAAHALAAIDGEAGGTRAGRLAFALEGLLGFQFGVKGERSREAREAARALSQTVRHFNPGTVVPLPADLPGFRVHVLAPPRDRKLLRLLDDKDKTYGMGDAGLGSPGVAALTRALAINDRRIAPADDPAAPFATSAGIRLSSFFDRHTKDGPSLADRAFLSAHYAGPSDVPYKRGFDRPGADQQWRRIDDDWLDMAGELALQLDSKTNNSSMVLAVEIVATGRVLVFAADAQIGNWESWGATTFRYADGTEVTGADLLSRTVFYKVGHHGSSNATMSEGGLEAMTSLDLTAFIPTDKVMAKKVGWGDIPADALTGRLMEKTGGRMIRSDDPRIQSPDSGDSYQRGGSLQDFAIDHGFCIRMVIG